MSLTLKTIRTLESDALSFVFEPSTPMTWKAGQYIHYTLKHPNADDRGAERWFTISSAPSEKEIVITTRIFAGRKSSFKTALLDLKPGDTIEADAPEGDFVIEDPNRNYLFVAGGIGITPYRSILTEAAAQGRQLNAELLYANRTDEIVFKNELETLQSKNPYLAIDYVVEPRKLDAEMIKQRAEHRDDPLIYISGPEPMVEAFIAKLSEMGYGHKVKGDYFPGYEA